MRFCSVDSVNGSVVIIFRHRGFCILTNKPCFDEIASPAVFHLRHEIRCQWSWKVPRGFNEFRSLQEKDIAPSEAARYDQTPLDFDRKLSQRIRILKP